MQGFQASAGHASNFFHNPTHQPFTLITPKRVIYAVVGAFVFVGAAVVLNSGAASLGSNNIRQSSAQGQGTSNATTDTTSNEQGTQTSTNFSANTSGDGSTDVQLNVNGQNIAVPQNGTTQQTVMNNDGSQTTVHTSSNTASQGDATNTSSSSFSLNVQSNSSAAGGTASQ